MSDQIEPTQADRDAAGDLWREFNGEDPDPNDGVAAEYLEATAYAFAAHRQSEYARGLEDAAKVARAYLAMSGTKVRKSKGGDDLAAHGCTVAADIASSILALMEHPR